MIRRVYPKQFNSSIGASLVYRVPGKATGTDWAVPPEPPLVSVTVWKMGSGYVDS
jgi:hypothetical protein